MFLHHGKDKEGAWLEMHARDNLIHRYIIILGYRKREKEIRSVFRVFRAKRTCPFNPITLTICDHHKSKCLEERRNIYKAAAAAQGSHREREGRQGLCSRRVSLKVPKRNYEGSGYQRHSF